MPKVNLQTASKFIEHEREFESSTGSLKGINLMSNGTRSYIVFSYSEPIARVDYVMTQEPDGDITTERQLWFTPRKFSVTTSRHTNLARRALSNTHTN